MIGSAAKLVHDRALAEGYGTNEKALKFLNQDYETIRNECLQSGTLFKDSYFPAIHSSLGYNELGANSSKVQGVVWKRPTVSHRLQESACCMRVVESGTVELQMPAWADLLQDYRS